MSDIPDTSVVVPVTNENVYGIGVAGPPVELPEEAVQEEAVIQRENSEYSDEDIGRNIDIEV